MNYKLQIKNDSGYTIIETMIAVSIFTIIVMIGMGALLSANTVSQKSQGLRSVMDSLSFSLEDMSRNLRTGTDYHCITDGNIYNTAPQSCSVGGGGISFKSSIDGSEWVYYIGANPNNPGTYSIFKLVGGVGGTPVQLTPDEIAVDSASSFAVLGAEPTPGDTQQPFVIIKLLGKITYKDVVTPFSLQTSVSQRAIDI